MGGQVIIVNRTAERRVGSVLLYNEQSAEPAPRSRPQGLVHGVGRLRRHPCPARWWLRWSRSTAVARWSSSTRSIRAVTASRRAPTRPPTSGTSPTDSPSIRASTRSCCRIPYDQTVVASLDFATREGPAPVGLVQQPDGAAAQHADPRPRRAGCRSAGRADPRDHRHAPHAVGSSSAARNASSAAAASGRRSRWPRRRLAISGGSRTVSAPMRCPSGTRSTTRPTTTSRSTRSSSASPSRSSADPIAVEAHHVVTFDPSTIPELPVGRYAVVFATLAADAIIVERAATNTVDGNVAHGGLRRRDAADRRLHRLHLVRAGGTQRRRRPAALVIHNADNGAGTITVSAIGSSGPGARARSDRRADRRRATRRARSHRSGGARPARSSSNRRTGSSSSARCPTDAATCAARPGRSRRADMLEFVRSPLVALPASRPLAALPWWNLVVAAGIVAVAAGVGQVVRRRASSRRADAATSRDAVAARPIRLRRRRRTVAGRRVLVRLVLDVRRRRAQGRGAAQPRRRGGGRVVPAPHRPARPLSHRRRAVPRDRRRRRHRPAGLPRAGHRDRPLGGRRQRPGRRVRSTRATAAATTRAEPDARCGADGVSRGCRGRWPRVPRSSRSRRDPAGSAWRPRGRRSSRARGAPRR